MRPSSAPLRKRLFTAAMRHFGLFARADRVYFFLVPLVGVATGLLSVGISRLMDWTEWLFWGTGGNLDILQAARESSAAWRFLAPTLGGVAIAIIMLLARRPLVSAGTSSLLESVALRGGHLATLNSLLVQAVAVFTVGAGGSAGREGPLTVSGATFASKIGRLMGVRGNPLKILVGCGTAAGMAAAYNAPVGGALFAMEVVLGNFALDIFGPIVISAVLATVISREFLFTRDGGFLYHVPIPTYELGGPAEIFLFALLGVVSGVLAVLFIKSMEWGERGFDALPIPVWLKPVVGFGLVGLVGVFCPYVYGNGYETVDLVLKDELLNDVFGPLAFLGPWLLLALPLIKLSVTSITIGCGGAGGLFTPSLFVGGLVGSAFGMTVLDLFGGGLSSSPAPYALVGMAAIASATTHAPLSSILIIYEITRRYDLILPLMAACILSNLVARKLCKDSLFTARLRRRGVVLPHRLEEIVLETMSAKDIVREDSLTLRSKDAVPAIFEHFLETRRNHLYVLGRKNSFLGAVSLHDLKRVMLQSKDLGFLLSIDVLHQDFPFVLASDRLTSVLEVFAQYDYERLPVLEDSETRKFLGFISKRDLMSVYNQEVLQRPTLLAKFTSDADEDRTTYVELPPRYRIDQVSVGEELAGKTLTELAMPARMQTHVLEVKRTDDRMREFRVIPDGTTKLEAGDRLVLLGPAEKISRLKIDGLSARAKAEDLSDHGSQDPDSEAATG